MASFYSEKPTAPPTVRGIHEKCLLPEEGDRSAQHNLVTLSPPCPLNCGLDIHTIHQPKLKGREHLLVNYGWFPEIQLWQNTFKC